MTTKRWPCEETTYDFKFPYFRLSVRLWVTNHNALMSADELGWWTLVSDQLEGSVKHLAHRIATEGAPMGLAAVQVKHDDSISGHMIYCIEFDA